MPKAKHFTSKRSVKEAVRFNYYHFLSWKINKSLVFPVNLLLRGTFCFSPLPWPICLPVLKGSQSSFWRILRATFHMRISSVMKRLHSEWDHFRPGLLSAPESQRFGSARLLASAEKCLASCWKEGTRRGRKHLGEDFSSGGSPFPAQYHFFNLDLGDGEAGAFRGSGAIYNQKKLIQSKTLKRRGLGYRTAHVEGVLHFAGYPSVLRPRGKQSRRPDAPDLPSVREAYAGATKKECALGRGPTEVTVRTAYGRKVSFHPGCSVVCSQNRFNVSP